MHNTQGGAVHRLERARRTRVDAARAAQGERRQILVVDPRFHAHGGQGRPLRRIRSGADIAFLFGVAAPTF